MHFRNITETLELYSDIAAEFSCCQEWEGASLTDRYYNGRESRPTAIFPAKWHKMNNFLGEQ